MRHPTSRKPRDVGHPAKNANEWGTRREYRSRGTTGAALLLYPPAIAASAAIVRPRLSVYVLDLSIRVTATERMIRASEAVGKRGERKREDCERDCESLLHKLPFNSYHGKRERCLLRKFPPRLGRRGKVRLAGSIYSPGAESHHRRLGSREKPARGPVNHTCKRNFVVVRGPGMDP